MRDYKRLRVGTATRQDRLVTMQWVAMTASETWKNILLSLQGRSQITVLIMFSCKSSKSPISKGLALVLLPSSWNIYFLCAKSNFIPVLHLAHPFMQVLWGERSAGEASHGGGGPLGVTNTNKNCAGSSESLRTLGKKQSREEAVSP